MDARVWTGLPDDLLLEVLPRVPPFLLFRLRPVSCRWAAILHDLAFLTAHAACPPMGNDVVTFSRGGGAAHSPPQCRAAEARREEEKAKGISSRSMVPWQLIVKILF